MASSSSIRWMRERGRAVREAARYYLSGLAGCVLEHNVFLWSQAIAFKVLVAILPILLLATGVFGLVLRGDPFETVAGYLRTFLPGYQSAQIVGLLAQLQDVGGRITVVGSVGLVFAVVTLFSTLRYVVGSAFGAGRFSRKSRLRMYGADALMAGRVLLLFVASFGVTVLVSLVLNQDWRWLGETGLDPRLMHRLGRRLLHLSSLVVPYVLTLGMFVQMYYYMPHPRPPLRSALFGGLIGALLFEVAKNLFTLYAVQLGTFSRYFEGTQPTGAEGEAAGGVLVSVFGLILVLVAWVYLSGLTLVIGALLASLHERRHAATVLHRHRKGMRHWLGVLRRRRDRRTPTAAAALPPTDDPEAAS